MSANTSAKGPSWAVPAALAALYERRWLAWYFAQRQISRSYRNSFLGLFWMFLGPLLMIVLYTLVFSEIIGLRFQKDQSVTNFGLFLYCGLLPFLAFSDTLNKGVISIRANSTLVQKVVFPLEILPLTTAATALVNQIFGFGALLVLVAILEGGFQWTLALLPIVFVPQLLFTLGLGFLAAVLGAYLPDLKESLQSLVRAMFFVTPILWPADRVPERLSWLVDFNPLALLVDAYRDLILRGEVPSPGPLLWFTLFAAGLCVVGFVLFVRVKGRFADLI